MWTNVFGRQITAITLPAERKRIMTHIEPYELWLGHAGDGRNVSAILDNQIQAVVQLAIEEPLLILPRELIYLCMPLDDGPDNDRVQLRLAVESLLLLLRANISTLVCCSAGASRSPAVASFAIASRDSKSPSECLLAIRKLRGTDISPGLWQSLLDTFSNPD